MNSVTLETQEVKTTTTTKKHVKRQRRKLETKTTDATTAKASFDNVRCVCVQLRVRRENVDALQRWFDDTAHKAHEASGHILSTMIVGEGDGGKPVRDVFILYAFHSLDDAVAWHASPTKRQVMESLASQALVESSALLGGSGVLRVDDGDVNYGVMSSGWESIFMADDVDHHHLQSSPRAQPAGPPPRWKQCVAVYIAVSTVVSLFGLPGSLSPTIARQIGADVDPWRGPAVVFLSALVIVPAIVFVVLPAIIWLARPWLSAPKPLPPPADAPFARRFCYAQCC